MNHCAEPIVLTSLNPNANSEHQFRCFAAWQAAGFDIRSVNVREETKRILEWGVAPDNLLILRDEETGLETSGKPVPSVLPILRRARAVWPGRDLILTNSDIYPAIRSAGITRFWSSSCGGAVGLTREECHAVEAYTFRASAPYRGGLDTFFVASDRLATLVEVLEETSSAPWMAFGAVGWDYLMGAAILSERVRGSVMDGAVLVHRAHRATYGSVDRFERFARDLHDLGFVTTPTSAEAARQFSVRLKVECERNRALSRAVKRIYFRSVRTEIAGLTHTSCAVQAYRDVASVAPGLLPRTTNSGLATLAQRLLSDSDASFGMVLSYFMESPSHTRKFVECLIAIAFALYVRRTTGEINTVTEYPRGNRHGEALRQIVQNTRSDSAEQRLEVACLFGTELVDRCLFNPRLYDYLVLSTQNTYERKLLGNILSKVDVINHVA